MSGTNWNGNVGASWRASDAQQIADIASAADDRAMEILATPGAAQKKIIPLSEESLTLVPRQLVVGKDTDGTLANGLVRVRPSYFEAGVLSDPNTIGIAGKVDANLDSGAFLNNSSGSTRTDLLYATLSYGAAITQSVRQKPTSGGQPISTNLVIDNVITITLGIVAGVSSTTPAASLPADSGAGKLAVYNFALAAVSIANGFSGGAINQAAITPLWNGGFVPSGRVRLIRHGSLVDKTTGTTGKATTPLSDRWPSINRMVVPVVVTATSQTIILDDSIDWRQRIITIRAMRPFTDGTNTAMKALENTAHIPGVNANVTFGPACTSGLAGSAGQIIGSDATPYWQFKMGTGGGTALVAVYQTQTLLSGTAASDVWWFDIDYTDQFVF